MKIQEAFSKQQAFDINGIMYWYVMSNKTGTLEVHRVPVGDMETFLEGHKLVHSDYAVPRFELAKK